MKAFLDSPMSIHAKRIGLMVFSIALFFLIGEIASRYWLKHWATKDQYYDYALYTDIPAQEWVLSPHHYQIYYPTPNYRVYNKERATWL